LALRVKALKSDGKEKMNKGIYAKRKTYLNALTLLPIFSSLIYIFPFRGTSLFFSPFEKGGHRGIFLPTHFSLYPHTI
jgi:hypothetical protein